MITITKIRVIQQAFHLIFWEQSDWRIFGGWLFGSISWQRQVLVGNLGQLGGISHCQVCSRFYQHTTPWLVSWLRGVSFRSWFQPGLWYPISHDIPSHQCFSSFFLGRGPGRGPIFVVGFFGSNVGEQNHSIQLWPEFLGRGIDHLEASPRRRKFRWSKLEFFIQLHGMNFQKAGKTWSKNGALCHGCFAVSSLQFYGRLA